MTQEEKAKAYDEAIEKAVKIHNEHKAQSFDVMLKVFPELKEESKDEKIMKEIISYIKSSGAVTNKEWIAWLENQGEPVEMNTTEFDTRLQALIGKFNSLPKEELIGSLSFWTNVVQNDGTYKSDEKQGEQKPYGQRQECADCQFNYAGECKGSCGMKQGEQKPTDKDEPKFNIGDLITNGIIIGKVDENDNNKYYGWFGYDKDLSVHYADIPDVENWHLWTIQDAKDGDVLSYVTDEEDLWIMIYRSLYEPYEGHVHYHALLVNDNFADKGTCCICIDNLKPATQEQRDLLFQKMKEAGYEWDVEKKKLKRIEQKNEIDIPFGAKDSEFLRANYYIPEGFHAEIKGNRVFYEVTCRKCSKVEIFYKRD